MKVLLLGATGNVGSRLLSALLAHNHGVVAYVRDPSKLSGKQPTKTVRGSATDIKAIKAAILDNDCDAVINAAGLAALFTKTTQFPAIFAAVAQAAVEAGEDRGSPLRAWFMSGFGLLDAPGTKHKLMEYVPIYPDHQTNYDLITSIPANKLHWSLFCANAMAPGAVESYSVSVDVPPLWTETMRWLPLLGTWLNIFIQIGTYGASLEGCTEFIVSDLDAGESQYVWEEGWV